VDSRYDLVHCRLLLIHVSPVEVALRNILRRHAETGVGDKVSPPLSCCVLRQHCRQFLPHALRLLHFGKIGVDKAQAFNALVAEGAPDDHNIRSVRREQAGERATNTVRAADHGDFLPRREPPARGLRSQWTSLRRTPFIFLDISANFILSSLREFGSGRTAFVPNQTRLVCDQNIVTRSREQV
jgi:hypothetical protein